jgi:hypothetical protein
LFQYESLYSEELNLIYAFWATQLIIHTNWHEDINKRFSFYSQTPKSPAGLCLWYTKLHPIRKEPKVSQYKLQLEIQKKVDERSGWNNH